MSSPNTNFSLTWAQNITVRGEIGKISKSYSWEGLHCRGFMCFVHSAMFVLSLFANLRLILRELSHERRSYCKVAYHVYLCFWCLIGLTLCFPHKVYVAEPNAADSISIRGLKEKYEGHHDVKIQDRALVTAAELSAYTTGRHLPDKAITLVDEACANVRPLLEETDNLERKRTQLEVELLALEKEKDKSSKARLAGLRRDLDDLRDRLQPLMMRCRKENERTDELRRLKQRRDELVYPSQEAEKRDDLSRAADSRNRTIQEVETAITETVGLDQTAEVVSKWTGTPLTYLKQNEKERLICLADRLQQRVVGHLIIRIDMSEYMEQHSIVQLIGVPPCYVGHDEAGKLTEVEKAHSIVFSTLLQVLDDGRLTHGQCQTVDLTNTVIKMTSNLGAEYLFRGLMVMQDVYNVRLLGKWLEKMVVTELLKLPAGVETDENSAVYIDASRDWRDLSILVNAANGEKSYILIWILTVRKADN